MTETRFFVARIAASCLRFVGWIACPILGGIAAGCSDSHFPVPLGVVGGFAGALAVHIACACAHALFDLADRIGKR